MGSKQRKKSSARAAVRRAHIDPSAQNRLHSTEASNPPVPVALGRPRPRPAARRDTGGPPKARAVDRSKGSKDLERARSAFFELPLDENQGRPLKWAAAMLEQAGPHAVAATYSFRAPDTGRPYSATVRFVGLRKNVDGDYGQRDQFERTERLEGLMGDGGLVALTARIQNVNSGEWRVLAEPIVLDGVPDRRSFARRVLETRSSPPVLAQGPNVRLWAWPVLVGLGALTALVIQSLLIHRLGISVPAVLSLALLACLLGFFGGKFWYLGLHRKPLTQFIAAGACIQGFLLVSLSVVALGSWALGLSVGAVLDATTPGIFLGVAVGRPGCFLTGCCAGRPTLSRWGFVSSDRRLVVRRIPVQLLEAMAGLAIGLLSMAAVLVANPAVPGSVFLAAAAAYTVVRQFLFPLRVESRTSRGRRITTALALLLLTVALSTFLL